MNGSPKKPSLPPAAIAALHRGNKIEAIKIVRAEQALDLKDSKEAVEAYIKSDLTLQASLATSEAQGCRKMLYLLATVMGLVLYALYLIQP